MTRQLADLLNPLEIPFFLVAAPGKRIFIWGHQYLGCICLPRLTSQTCYSFTNSFPQGFCRGNSICNERMDADPISSGLVLSKEFLLVQEPRDPCLGPSCSRIQAFEQSRTYSSAAVGMPSLAEFDIDRACTVRGYIETTASELNLPMCNWSLSTCKGITYKHKAIFFKSRMAP